MDKMKSDVPLDYAVFQLSPKRTRCELFVSSGGSTEKIASGLLKPFISHLKVAEEQVASSAPSVKLEVGRRKNAGVWFTKGTLERFVRFVSTPEVLELVSSSDAEMSQLEAARKIYSEGAGDQLSGGGASGATATDDATKMELLRAIDVRLMAVQQDLSTACARAAAAGFNLDTVSELQMFADRFGALRLNEACGKFIAVCQRRPNITGQWKSGHGDRAIRSSCGSDMSIDDEPSSPSPCQELIPSQQSNPPPVTFPLRRTLSRESSVDKDDGCKVSDAPVEKLATATPEQTESIQASQPARRLSVQDRINMFESKQKETSGGKPTVAKSVELRRMSSDLSTGTAADKSVLRRWSGASDMSIDLSAEKKDGESPLCTPSSTAVPQENKILNVNDAAAKGSSIIKPEIKVIPSLSRDRGLTFKEGFSKSEQYFESGLNSNLVPAESDGLKGKLLSKTQPTSFPRTADNQESSEEKLKSVVGSKSESAALFGDQLKLKGSQSGESHKGLQSQVSGIKNQDSSWSQTKPIESPGGGHFHFSMIKDQDSESWDEPGSQNTLKNNAQKTRRESGASEPIPPGARIRETFAARSKGIEVGLPSTQQEIKSIRETEAVDKEPHVYEKGSSGSVLELETPGSRRMKFTKQGVVADLGKKGKVQQDERFFSGKNSRTPFSGKVATEAIENSDVFSTPPAEQGQRTRQAKGNQELNDELKMKANELEKLFAEHKLRVPGDQLNSINKGKSEEMEQETPNSLQYLTPVPDVSQRLSHKSSELTGNSKNKTKSSSSLTKTIDGQIYGDALNKKFGELNVSDSSRGKFYDKYIQKRDAKLREEWSSNRLEKEARLRSMQDSLERNRSEMKAKFSGSADVQDSASSARRRAERLRLYNSRSTMKRDQLSLDFEDSEDDAEALDLSEKEYREDKALDDISSGDGNFRASQGKKLLPNSRSLSSTTPRTSAAPAPRSAKTTTYSGKRRMQPENPLAQSVPNFSDLRKENTKPSSGGSKTTRSQARTSARNKGTNEETAIVKDDKPRRLHATRKSSANPREFREMPSLDSDVDLSAIKIDEEVPKSVGPKSFLKKGSRASFVSQASIQRQKFSLGSEPVNNVDENDGMNSEPDELGVIVKDVVEEDFKIQRAGELKNLDEGEPMAMVESEKFVNSGSENGDGTLSFSRVGQVLGSQMSSEIPSSFLPVDVQDWPSESPMSWNLHGQHSFSYPHEMSDVDASVDSPVGSPASWNSHSLNQIDSDASRMRKKWGMAQKPTLVAHSSNSSRKDMTRGFKRLLKFGRKNRGSESLADWISATTSEGDDDTEDGRDPANRSSEDLRKSRMRFSQAQPSDDSFTEHDVFSESVQSSESSIPAPPANFKLREDHLSGSSIKAPRSFFSLSTFRSKGSESKPR